MFSQILSFLFVTSQTIALQQQQQKFDGYDAWDWKSSNEGLVYGYSPESVCTITKFGNGYYGTIGSAFSFEKSASSRLKSAATTNVKVHNCFVFNGYSYFVTQDLDTEFTSFIRNGAERTFRFPLNYTRMLYDHAAAQLYLIAESGGLYNFHLHELENWWNGLNHVKSLMARHKNLSLSILYDRVQDLPENLLDAMVFNGALYLLKKDGQVYKQRLGLEKTDTIMDQQQQLMNREKFSFILFQQSLSSYHTETPVRISTFLFENMADTKTQNLWIYLLYITDALILIAAVYFLKIKIEGGRKKRFSLGGGESIYDQQNDRPLIRIATKE